MKAVVCRRYGSPDVLELRDVLRPVAGSNEVLVRVHAAGVNPADWHLMSGTPYLVRIGGGGLFKPKRQIAGTDMAGTVEAVGTAVTRFQPGDEVFGEVSETYAEYTSVAEDKVVLKPPNASFEQTAAVPIAGLTALQGLRDRGRIKAGQQVLVVGASGGVGTFAVQIAKSYAAEVTAVCSTRNVEMVRSIGADHVIDYTTEDFTAGDQRYDLILDTVGKSPLPDLRRVMAPEGIYVGVGGPKTSTALLTRMFSMMRASRDSGQKMVSMLAKANRADLNTLRELIESGDVTPVIDRRFSLSEAADALRYQGEGHAAGKSVIIVRDE